MSDVKRHVPPSIRVAMDGKTCDVCQKPFGEHSDEQFGSCFKRFREERKQLQKEGKIPTPKIRATISVNNPKTDTTRLRAKIGAMTCCVCSRLFNDHTDAELFDCLVKQLPKAP